MTMEDRAARSRAVFAERFPAVVAALEDEVASLRAELEELRQLYG